MTNLTGKSSDILGDNIEKLKALFPEVECEGKIDFEKLKQILGQYVDDEKERYDFKWNGKGRALRLSQTPSMGTLRPCVEESKDWDTTENLYIEGDNLEVLKLLQKSYHGKVKMIYIDPPYNTGGDFVYPDNYHDSLGNYKKLTGQVDEDGKKLSTNSESNGRYHTDWLNMMYPRLRLARALLADDGVIFLSIDDNEISNLRKICDEIFDEANLLAQFVWNTEGHTDNQFDIKINHEYILAYAKNLSCCEIGWVVDKNTREGSNLWKGFAENSITKNGEKNPPQKVVLKAGFPCAVESLQLEKNNPIEQYWEDVKRTGYITRQMTERYKVSYPIRMNEMIVENYKLKYDVEVFSGWGNADKLRAFNIDFQPIEESDGTITFYLSKNGVIYYYKKRDKARNIVSVLKDMGTTEKMRSDLERSNIFFSYPKPKELLKYLICIGNPQEKDIVLDFFSGSATIAHAVLELNAKDNGNRKFICVQLPEPTDEKSEAYNAGFSNICEIGKERIRRAGEKIKAEVESGNQQLKMDEEPKKVPDIGFKVLKLDTSNLKKWQPDYDDLETSLYDMVSNFMEGRTELDVVYEIMVKMGLPLTMPVETMDEDGTKLYTIGGGMLMICLADTITLPIAHAMVRHYQENQPELWKVVCKDNGFRSDTDKVNIIEILKAAGLEEDAFTTI